MLFYYPSKTFGSHFSIKRFFHLALILVPKGFI